MGINKVQQRRNAEATVVESINVYSKHFNIPASNVEYASWIGFCKEEAPQALDAYKLLGTKFGVIKQANFQNNDDSVNPVRLEIAGRARKAKKASDQLSSDALFFDRFEEMASKLFSNKIVPTGFSKSKSNQKMPRHLNLILSDLHFHSLLDPLEVPLRYGPVEEARRLAAVVLQTCQYKEFYRKETQLNLHLLGDIIQNQLYDARDGAPLAEQVCASIHLLSQAVAVLAAHFPKVVIRCATGNHGRNTARHQQRATLQKWDSIETMIYYAVKKACSSLQNVTMEIPKLPYYEYDSFGSLSFGTHGDTVLNPGYPNNIINVKLLEQQANKLSATRKDGKKYDLFFVGHVHTGSLINLPSATFITNGALIPSDQYATSIGILNNKCGQYMWESVPGHVVGDSRFIEVNEKTDADASLDKIILPFNGF